MPLGPFASKKNHNFTFKKKKKSHFTEKTSTLLDLSFKVIYRTTCKNFIIEFQLEAKLALFACFLKTMKSTTRPFCF